MHQPCINPVYKRDKKPFWLVHRLALTETNECTFRQIVTVAMRAPRYSARCLTSWHFS